MNYENQYVALHYQPIAGCFSKFIPRIPKSQACCAGKIYRLV